MNISGLENCKDCSNIKLELPILFPNLVKASDGIGSAQPGFTHLVQPDNVTFTEH